MSSHFDVPALGATASGEDMNMISNFDRGIDPTAEEDIELDLDVPIEDWIDQDPDYALEDVRAEAHAAPPLNVGGQDEIMYEEDEAVQGIDGHNQNLELADTGDLAHATLQGSSAGSFEANGGVSLGDIAQQAENFDAQAARANMPEASWGRTLPTSDGKAVAMNAGGGKAADMEAKPIQGRQEVHEHTHRRGTEATISAPRRLHPVFVYYQETDISLFPPSIEDASDTFFLQDSSLANASLSELFAAMRCVLARTIREQDDLELAIDDLGLCINEDSIACQRKSLADLVKLWVDLNRHDGIERPDPLYMTLKTKAGCGGRLNELIAAVTEGKGISSLHLWDDVQDNTANDMHTQARPQATANKGLEMNDQSTANELLKSGTRGEFHEASPAASGPEIHDIVTQAPSIVEQPADELVITEASVGKAIPAVVGPMSDARQEPPPQTSAGSLQTGPSAKGQAELDRKSSRQVYEEAVDEDLIDYEDDESLAPEGDPSRASLSGVKIANAPDDGTADDSIMQCFWPDPCLCPACDDLPLIETKPQDTATARQGAPQVTQLSRPTSEALKYDLEDELEYDSDPLQEQATEGQPSGRHVGTGHTESYDTSLATGELATNERNGTPKLAPHPHPQKLQEQSICYEEADDYDLDEDTAGKDPDLIDYDLDEDIAEKDPDLIDYNPNEDIAEKDPDHDQYDLNKDIAEKLPDFDDDETLLQAQEDYGQYPPANAADGGRFDDSIEDEGPVELLDQPNTHEPNAVHGEQDSDNGYDDLDYSGDAVAGYELDTEADLLPIDVDADLDLYGEDDDTAVQPQPSGSVGAVSEVSGVHANRIAPAIAASHKRPYPELGERVAHEAANQDSKRIRSA